jgi:hypothetical protein
MSAVCNVQIMLCSIKNKNENYFVTSFEQGSIGLDIFV